MYCLTQHVVECFNQRLRVGGVSVDGIHRLIHRDLHLHDERSLGDDLCGGGSDDVHAQDLTVTVVGDHLHEAHRITRSEGTSIGSEVEPADAYIIIFLPSLLLGHTHLGYLGRGVDHGGCREQVHLAVVTLHRVLGGHLTHAEGDVCQHLDAVHIAGGVDPLHAGLHILVHLDLTPFNLGLHLTQSLQIGCTTNGDERLVGDHRILAFDVDLQLIALVHDLGNAGGGHHLYPFLLQVAEQLCRHLLVECGHDAIHHLDDDHLRSQTRE